MTNVSGSKVLLLDDEKMLLQLYQLKFEKSGYEVATFYDPDNALAALQGGYKPDVILFDITMPQQRSGYEFLEIVQKQKLAKNSLKIALTNENQEGEVARTLELGADKHWMKSEYIPSELVAEVTKLLSERKRSWWQR